jgi:hypothetical protein
MGMRASLVGLLESASLLPLDGFVELLAATLELDAGDVAAFLEGAGPLVDAVLAVDGSFDGATALWVAELVAPRLADLGRVEVLESFVDLSGRQDVAEEWSAALAALRPVAPAVSPDPREALEQVLAADGSLSVEISDEMLVEVLWCAARPASGRVDDGARLALEVWTAARAHDLGPGARVQALEVLFASPRLTAAEPGDPVAQAVLVSSLVVAAGAEVKGRFVAPFGLLSGAALALGRVAVDGGAPEPHERRFDLWCATAEELFVATGDVDAAALPFGVRSCAELDDDSFAALMTWWWGDRPGSDVLAPRLDELLVAATEGGARRRELNSEVLRFTSPSLPLEVAVACRSVGLVRFELADELVAAAAGSFGHRWDAAALVEALRGDPPWWRMVAEQVPSTVSTQPALEVPAALVDASMSEIGLGAWCGWCPRLIAERIAAAASGGDGLVLSDAGWRFVFAALDGFFGTPEELVGVAAAVSDDAAR